MLPDKVKDQILKLKYNGNVSQYGWVIDDKVIECNYNGCHSQILSYPPGKITQAWSFGPNIPDIRLAYLMDITVSPWRTIVPTIALSTEEIKAGSPFVFNDLSLDANLIVNMMFSLRWPAEQVKSYNLWERLLLQRVHPAVADLLTALIATRDQTGKPFHPDKLRYTTTQLMHSNFVALDCSVDYAKNFVNGAMLGGNGNPFDKTPTSGCANDYTHSSKSRGYKPVVGAFGEFKVVPFMDQLKGVRGPYMAFLETLYGLLKDFNHLVEIGHLEQKRFGLEAWPVGLQYADVGIEHSALDKVEKLEKSRNGKSHWDYVQTASKDPNHAHAF